MIYLLCFLLAFAAAAALTPWVKRLAFRIGAVDYPGEARRIHTKPMARLGGVAIYLAFMAVTLAVFPFSRQLWGLLGGITVLVIVGALDDRKSLSPWVKLFWQIVAAGIALCGGIGIFSITNPFGGVITLDQGRFALTVLGVHFHITPLANALSLLWMVGVINTINFLDGLDGLATGVSGIAAFIMFLLCISPRVNQPQVALLALILAGSAFGFLPFNFNPASIFLGDSGSQFMGLALAMLAIYSGAKLATASLVLGFTIIDGLWTVLRRLYRHVSPFKADRKHFHHLLLDVGFSQRQAVLLMYLIAIAFGTVALLVGSYAKLVALVALLLFMAVAIATLLVVSGRRARKPLS
jgi:UDP-GlcNAc:undecaprenyl-phosphate GlcNAc-1-phosphate transferase